MLVNIVGNEAEIEKKQLAEDNPTLVSLNLDSLDYASIGVELEDALEKEYGQRFDDIWRKVEDNIVFSEPSSNAYFRDLVKYTQEAVKEMR